MGLQVRIVGIMALALVVLATSVATLLASPPPSLQASDDDPAGICVHLRPLDPDHEFCLWLTRVA